MIQYSHHTIEIKTTNLHESIETLDELCPSVDVADTPDKVESEYLDSWFAHFWTRFSHLWCSSGDDSSILKRGKNMCFTEKCPSSLKARKAFSVKTVVPLSISLYQKSMGNDPYFIQILRHFLASSGEYNSFYAPKNERTVSLDF